MERSRAVVWTCLLGALALPPAYSVTTSEADPRPPRLLRCVFLNRANATCHWDAGDIQTTHYTLQVQLVFILDTTQRGLFSSDCRTDSFLRLPPNSSAKEFTCITPNTSCTAAFEGTDVRSCFCISITAHGPKQNITSRPRCQSGRTEVMLPPAILTNAKSVSRSAGCLTLTWRHTLSMFPVAPSEIISGKLNSQIEFTTQGQSHAHVQNVEVTGDSFLVCIFRPDTSYTIRLRLRFRGPESPWSPWSNTCRGRTREDAPSAAPAFWRQVKQTDKEGWRLLTLLWKPLPHFLANGRILFYNVTCQTESSQVLKDHGSCRDLHHTTTSCSLLLPAGRCSCALTASTSAGASPAAQIWFSGASETNPPAPSQFTVSPLNDSGLDVRWTAAVDRSITSFVLEWFAVREQNSSVLLWEVLSSSCTERVITGVKPMERYAVSVRALYRGRGAGQNRTVHVYTRQGAPSAGPKVSVQQISGSKVVLTWSPVPVEQLHGFIRNFTIIYITLNHSTERVILPGSTPPYSLEDLSPGDYDIFMQANTDVGAGAAGPKAKVHIGPEEVSIVLYAVLPLILTSLALVLMACLAQNKNVRKKLFRDIPNPSNSSMAHWSPKINVESIKWPTMAERPEILYSEVVFLDECELQSPDTDQDLDYQRDLQTYFCHRNTSPPVSGVSTPENIIKSENDCIKSPTRAKTTSDTDLSSIYANVIFPETLKSVPLPLTSPTYLQSLTWQHSSVSSNDVKRQLGGDSKLSVSSTRSDSPPCQTDELKNILLFLRQHQSLASSRSSSILLYHPAQVTAPKPFSQSLYRSVPSLQANTCPRSDDLLSMSGSSSHSVFVDFSYLPAVRPISPAV
ncbi:hypothetical protein PBY51_010886 [Eleginops maclovinus]|uniref:Fibronectin type-III domain-containing protein n=1 Tax=Eleginops maclovinus TaxID=56733 RepID=A0AAN7X7C5_ELEMC|nr:hypothetical protein PBY51_010886 [Eleginops maclovinus]